MIVVVLGAGVAGLATALALAEVGFEPRVFEALPTIAADDGFGGLLHVNPAGQRALAELGLGPQVGDLGFPVSAIELEAADGTHLGRFEAEGGDYRYIARGDLLGLLEEAVTTRSIPVARGRVAARVTSGGEPSVTFTDGESLTADLVVGADGPSSTARNAVDGARLPTYTGQWFLHGVADAPVVSTAPRTVRVVRDSRTGHAFGSTTLSDGATTHWWLRAWAGPFDSGAAVTPDQLAELTPAGVPIHELVAQSGGLSSYNAFAVEPDGPWRETGVVLVGDAAHACSPAASQSTALAAEDGIALAAALRDAPRSTALELYEQLRRARVRRAIAAGNPRNGVAPGPTYEIGLSSVITAEIAAEVERDHRLDRSSSSA